MTENFILIYDLYQYRVAPSTENGDLYYMTGVFRTSDERVTVVEEKSLYPDEELVADIGNTVTLIKKRWYYFRRFTWILSWFEYFEANLANGHVLHENSALWIKTQTTTNEAWKVQAWKDNQKDYQKGTSNCNLVTIVEINKNVII